MSSAQSQTDGFEQYAYFPEDVSFLYVIEIISQFLSDVIYLNTVSLIYLSPAGPPRFYPVASVVERNFFFIFSYKIFELCSRTDNAHFSLEDVYHLRNFIETGFSYPFAKRYNSTMPALSAFIHIVLILYSLKGFPPLPILGWV